MSLVERLGDNTNGVSACIVINNLVVISGRCEWYDKKNVITFFRYQVLCGAVFVKFNT